MKKLRMALITAMLLLVAFATMAPHWHTWGGGIVGSIEMEMDADEVTQRGNQLHGDAEITLKIPGERNEPGQEYAGTARIIAKCVFPLCGGLVQGSAVLGTRDAAGNFIPGEGRIAFSGDFNPTRGVCGKGQICLTGSNLDIKGVIGLDDGRA